MSWFSVLLLYTLLLFITSINLFSSSVLLLLPFFVFIPGYALSLILPLRLSKQDVLVLSLAFSLALFSGTDTILKITGYGFWTGEREVMTVFSASIFLLKLLDTTRKFRHHGRPSPQALLTHT